tara:strand:+ start:5899 stop:6165 length:267 start_codon:yes stop_codon:yes gene_type:complete
MEQEPHNSFTNPSPQTTRLIEVLQSLETHIKRQNSLKYALVKGIFYGLGTVIGATILVALLGSIFSWTLENSDEQPEVIKSANELLPN